MYFCIGMASFICYLLILYKEIQFLCDMTYFIVRYTSKCSQTCSLTFKNFHLVQEPNAKRLSWRYSIDVYRWMLSDCIIRTKTCGRCDLVILLVPWTPKIQAGAAQVLTSHIFPAKSVSFLPNPRIFTPSALYDDKYWPVFTR